jgi:hypothetical protein
VVSTTSRPYFDWLCGQVQVEYGHTTENTYVGLFTCLYEKEFVWIIANDDNRCDDGKELRREFGFQSDEGCSILELILGLSRRLSFIAEGSPERWVWQLIENLKLHTFRDRLSGRNVEQIGEILDTLIWRTYLRDGSGGLFPLAFPDEDQRKVELWYQMSAYIEEMYTP